MFQINEVLRFHDARYRVLELLPRHLVWIDIVNAKALPGLATLDELPEFIDSGVLERVEDPYSELKYESPDEGSVARQKRDRNLEILAPLISLSEFYVPRRRGPIVEKIVKDHQTTKQTVYRLARQYWQRGQMPNALLPDYKKSGGKGRKRVAKDKKLGRPRKHQPGVGAIIDQETERLFRIAIDKCQFPQ